MRSYGEVIDVRTARSTGGGGSAGAHPAGAGAPEQFLWRGRVYLVRDVLAHWVELGSWWTAPGRPGVGGADRAAAVATPAPPVPPGPSGAAAPPPPRSVAVDVGAVEREVWRVEAAPGRSAAPGVYDLVRDVPAAHGPAYDAGPAAYEVGRDPDHPDAPGLRPGGHRPDAPQRWRLARALD